jgi:hypothetical protein
MASPSVLDDRSHETGHMHCPVIPERRAAANPEPITTGPWGYGFRLSAFGLGRNDADMTLVGGSNEADDPRFFLHLLDDLADFVLRQARLGKANAVETAP